MSVDLLYEILLTKKENGGNNVDILKVFGTNVRNYRRSLGLSQEKFAEMAGLHRTYISDIERFQRSIALENVQKIADALSIETYKLFIEGED